jgi:adenine phosphoribosyltransferase
MVFGKGKDIKILLTSKSQIKFDVVQEAFKSSTCPHNDKISIEQISVSGGTEQPFGTDTKWKRDSLKCAVYRIEQIFKNNTEDYVRQYDFIISIENGICKDFESPHPLIDSPHYDVADVAIYDVNKKTFYTTLYMPFSEMSKVPIPPKEATYLEKKYQKDGSLNETGGQIISREYELWERKGEIYNDKNWMKNFGLDRHIQIIKSLYHVIAILPAFLSDDIEDDVMLTPDFPVKGVTFQDYQNIFGNPQFAKYLGHYFANSIPLTNTERCVVGPELRGYMGLQIASSLECSHVMIRKGRSDEKIKMGGEIMTEPLKQKEYKEEGDVQEFFYCKPELIKDHQIIIFDDILATGGSIDACCRLVEKCGGTVIKLCFLADVPELREKARETLQDKYEMCDVAFDSSVLSV